jgi:putative endonuclease
MGDPRRTLGSLGENLAAAHLERAGYRIADRNFRTRYGEIDIVAYDEGCLVFCEVKTRRAGGSTGPATPFEAIGHQKRQRLRMMAAEWFRERRSLLPRLPDAARFDAVAVVIDARGRLVRLDHLEAAF